MVLGMNDLSNLPVVAVFDFDGTLTYRDSFLPFLCKAVGRLRFWWGMFVLSPVLAKYALGFTSNWRAKEAFLTHFLADWTAEEMHRVADRFAVQDIPKILRPEALERVKWHQEQGHQLLIVSASPEAYLLPWAKTMGFDRVISTRLEVREGRLTGRMLGKNCHGLEKVQRLQEFLEDLNGYCLYVYGDSKGDRELLKIAKYPYYRKFKD
jgi:phosphatidylglycerophosphatase C